MSKVSEDGLRVLKAEIKNFKNISYKEVQFDGRSVIIAGPNQAGKSSFIQAITSPVNAKMIPIEPIKKGEERGSVQLQLGGKLHGESAIYNVGLYFSPEHQSGQVTLEDSEGNQIKGGAKKILKDLVGDISFDIMSFVRMGETQETGKPSKEGVRKQIEVLKSLMPQDVLQKLTNLDEERLKIYDERTEVNRDIKFFKSQIEKSGFTQEDIDNFSAPKDAESISNKLSEATKINDMIKKSEDYIKQSYIHIPNIEKQIEELMLKKVEIEKQAKVCSNFLSKNTRKDIEAINQEFNTIATHNANHEKIKALDETKKELLNKEKESNDITERLKEIEEEKKSIFSGSVLPVKGLEFDDEKITFRGLPLSEGNIPTSQLIGIGVKIGMALNPNLRLLVIRDGSLLDAKTTKFILDICEKEGYQLLIEVVKDGGEEVSIDFIEK